MKLGFVGSGFIARFQAAAIQQVRGLEIAGLVRRRGSEALAQYCRSHGLGEAKIHDSIGALANHVDAIAIYVPNFARIEVMEQLAAAVKAGRSSRASSLRSRLANMKEARRLVELAREAKPATPLPRIRSS
jgi:predicted dehydrogenase